MKASVTLAAAIATAALAMPAVAQAPAATVESAVMAGAKVLDPKGGEVGTVESVANGVAVVATGTNKVGLPLASFAVGPNGPVIGMTKAELDAAASGAQAKAAADTAAAVTTGASVSDAKGGAVGTIESVDAGFAVVATAKSKVKLPLTAFAKGTSGLVIGMTAAELDAAAATASPAPAAAK